MVCHRLGRVRGTWALRWSASLIPTTLTSVDILTTVGGWWLGCIPISAVWVAIGSNAENFPLYPCRHWFFFFFFFSKWKWNPTGKLHLTPLISTASGAISGRLDHVLLLDSDSSGRESEVDAAQISLTIIYFFVWVMTTTSQHVNIYKSCGVGRATKQQVWIHWEL